MEVALGMETPWRKNGRGSMKDEGLKCLVWCRWWDLKRGATNSQGRKL